MTSIKKAMRVLAAVALVPFLPLPGQSEGALRGALDLSGASAQPVPEPVSGESARAVSVPDERRPEAIPGGPAAATETIQFWEKLRSGALDGACKRAELKLKESTRVADDIVGLEGSVKRYLRSFPDGRIALIDEVNLNLSASYSYEVLKLAAGGVVNIGVSGGLAGQSMVVRPLDGKRFCSELYELAKVQDFKAVVPVTANRIMGMELDEIWKLPLTFSYGVGASAGYTSQGITISLGAGETRQIRPSVSVYRIAENALRVRFRIDTVRVRSVNAGAGTVEIPVEDVGVMGGEDALSRLVDKTLAKELNKFLAFKLGYSHGWTTGQKLLLEFVIDRSDRAQVENLAEFLKGDLNTLRRFAAKKLEFDGFEAGMDERSGAEAIGRMADDVGATIGAGSTFAGADHYNGRGSNLNVQVPFFYAHQGAKSSGSHRYQALNDGGGVLHVQQKSETSEGQTFNIPVFGSLAKHSDSRTVYVVNKELKDGGVGKPSMVYQRNEGFVGHTDSAARRVIENVNGVLKYAGTRGEGVNPGNTLPSAEIFPPAPPEEKPYADEPSTGKVYKAAIVTMKMAFSEKAVNDIIFAAPQMIVKAYMNMVRRTEAYIVDKVRDLFSVGEDGRVGYDRAAAARRLGISRGSEDEPGNPLRVVDTLARAATHIVRDILDVRAESDWKKQSEKLADAVSGGGRGGLKYDDYIRVISQLVDPKDMSAEVYVHTDKRVKGEPDVTQNYEMLNKAEHGYDKTLSDVTRMQQRFAEPTVMTD